MPIDIMFQRRSGEFSTHSTPKHYPADIQLEPKHTDIELTLDIAGRRAHGTVTHSVEANVSGTHTLRLDAVDLNIASVTSDDGQVSWDYDSSKLSITWEDVWEKGQTRQVAIAYEVVDPASGLFFCAPNKAYPDAATYAATDHETERARHWLPTIDLPNIRATLSFHLTSDANHTILANGTLEREDVHEDGTKTAHWNLDYPCPSYLICFAIGLFTCAEDGDYKGIPLAYYGDHTTKKEDLLRSFGRTGEMMDWLTQKLDCPFPFPKYFQFALPNFGGAMENISLVSWDDIFILDETLGEEWTWLVDQINIHEMAHSYFGDALVCRDYAEAWLKESWATYIETCWLEDKRGDDEMRYDFFRNAHAYFDEADNEYKRPLVTNQFDSSWQMYDRHLYPGGAVRLHMLRKWLGDDVFWAGVQEYVNTFKGKVVETSDFRKILEKHSGRSLVRFFEQWIYSPGYPNIEASFDWDDSKKRGTFKLTQKQVEASKGKEPTFTLPMTVAWTIDGKTYKRDFMFDTERHQLTIDMSQKPQMVRIDPDTVIVHKLAFNPSDEMLLHQLTHATDVVGRILAGQELAQTSKPANINAIKVAYGNEPFWGVRQKWVQALGGVNTQAATEALLTCLDVERDPLVLESVFAACSQHRDDAIKAAIIQAIEEDRLPYRAKMAAYSTLGGYGDAAPITLLKDATQQPTFRSFCEQGAIRGLVKTRNGELATHLRDLSRPGHAATRVRVTALVALGALAKYMENKDKEESIDRMMDALRDHNDLVRLAAARGLIAAKASRASGALGSFIKTLPHQDRMTYEKRMASLYKKQEPRLKSVESELEALTTKYKKLLKRLESLESKS